MPVIRFSRNVLRAVLSKCLAFVLRLSCVPVEMSCVRSRLLFAACAPNRTACDMFRSYSAVGRDRYSRVLECRVVIGLCWFISGLRVSLWRSRRRTKGRGERSRRRGRVRLCVTISALRRFPRGVRWGKRWKPHCGRAPDCAKEPLALWTLFIWVVMWGRFTRRRALGRNEDLTGLRSFCACHAFLSECLAFGSRLLFAA